MQQYYNLFIKEGFGNHLSLLYELNNNRLKSIGIKNIEHRNVISKQIYLTNLKNQTLFQNKSGVALRILFSEHKHENEYKQYLKICVQTERRAKNVTWATCCGFWQFWEFQQSKCRSSSMACEPIGNITGRYGSRKIGKSLGHVEIERCVRIKGSLKATKVNRRIYCAGVSNCLVDMDKGVLKSTVKRNKKRQKFPETGKVILRLNEAIQTRKYHVPIMVNSIEIRSTLHQINGTYKFNISQSESDQYQSNNFELKNDEDIETDCDMKSNVADDIEDYHELNIVSSDESVQMIDREHEDTHLLEFEEIQKNVKPVDFQNARETLTNMVNDIILYNDVNTYMENIDLEINRYSLFSKLKQNLLDLENVDKDILVTFYQQNELLQYIIGRIAVIIDIAFVQDILLFEHGNMNSIDQNDVILLKRHIQDMINKRIYSKSNVFSAQEEIHQPRECAHFEEKNNNKFVAITMNEIYLSLKNTIHDNTVLSSHEKSLILSNKPTKLHQYETVLLIKEYLVNNTTILRWFGNGMSDCSKATANFILFLSPEFFIDIENKNDLIESKILLILLRLFIICCEYQIMWDTDANSLCNLFIQTLRKIYIDRFDLGYVQNIYTVLNVWKHTFANANTFKSKSYTKYYCILCGNEDLFQITENIIVHIGSAI
eukprot:339376_1